MVDWKTIPKIDAHIHILPEDVIAANQGAEDPFILAGGVEAYIPVMEEYHISRAVVMPFNDPYLMSMTFQAADVHQNMMKLRQQYGDRFLLFADVDVRNPVGETIEELTRVLASGAFAGIKVHPSNAALPVDGDYYDAVFAFAETNQIPVEIHSFPHGDNAEDVCAPGRIARVLKRHPLLRVCVAHMGGLQFQELMGLKVYVNISAVLPVLTKHLGIAGANGALREFGTDRLIFGTDYPDSRTVSWEAIYPEYFRILNQMDFSESEAAQICRGNILNFLNIP